MTGGSDCHQKPILMGTVEVAEWWRGSLSNNEKFMNFNKMCDYLKGRTPIQEIPIQWDTKAYTSEAFNKWASSPEFKGWAGDKETEEETEVITKLLRVQRGDSLLDVGCGYGRHALRLAEKYGLKVTGIDISPGLITAAKKVFDGKGTGYYL